MFHFHQRLAISDESAAIVWGIKAKWNAQI